MPKPKLALIHGWGLNEAVWQNIIGPLSKSFDIQLVSLAGYGKRQNAKAATSIDELADDLLAQIPRGVIWCGWSLGGMGALAAAIKASGHIKALTLLCSTPKFVTGGDWQHGSTIETFRKFAEDLASDYDRGLKRFLLLQAGSTGHAKTLAKEASAGVNQLPAPTSETLMVGLDILEHTDLRNKLEQINIPTQIISGRRDRVASPAAGKYLADQITGATYTELNAGHAPHLSDPDELIELLSMQAKL